jgi:hypothetical protein
VKQNFPLIHAVGMASTARPAPDRPELGRSRSAQSDAGRQRASASTPAAST